MFIFFIFSGLGAPLYLPPNGHSVRVFWTKAGINMLQFCYNTEINNWTFQVTEIYVSFFDDSSEVRI